MNDIRIFSPSLAFFAVCDRARSLRATEEFDGAGAFSADVPLADAAKFPRGGIVLLPGAPGAYLIESVRADGGADTAQIAGRGVLAYFTRRILPAETQAGGTAASALLALARQYGAAALPGALTAGSTPETPAVEAALGRVSVYAAMRTVCRAARVGMRLDFNAAAGTFAFGCRTARAAAAWLWEDAARASLLEDDSGYVNRVTVVGGDGASVAVEAAGLFSDGTDDASEPVREMLYQARALTAARYASADEYEAALGAEGKRVLAMHRPVRRLHVSLDAEAAARIAVGDVIPAALPSVRVRAMCTARTVAAEGGVSRASAVMQVV